MNEIQYLQARMRETTDIQQTMAKQVVSLVEQHGEFLRIWRALFEDLSQVGVSLPRTQQEMERQMDNTSD